MRQVSPFQRHHASQCHITEQAQCLQFAVWRLISRRFAMHPTIRRVFNAQQSGLILVILLLGAILTIFAGSHVDRMTGRSVNNFLNFYTLMQTATDASFFAIMAVGATMVIISGGVDLSVGSIYALAGVTMALVMRKFATDSVGLALVICVGIGLAS